MIFCLCGSAFHKNHNIYPSLNLTSEDLLLTIMTEKNSGGFPLLAITNLDHVKTLHLAKGEVVGFARPESSEVTYIATTNELNVKEEIDVKPRNWIPQLKWSSHTQRIPEPQAMISEFREHSRKSRAFPDRRETGEPTTARKHDIEIAGVNTRIRRTFSKFAVARCRKGYERSTGYQL